MTASTTVRAHVRGLEVLRALNRRNYATALQISRDTDLPRGTVYRLLSTLVQAGFVDQPNDGEIYCLRSAVLSLSSGFDEKAGAVEAARSVVDKFSAEVGWPAYVHVYEAGSMTTRHVVRSPRAFAYPRMGSRVSMLRSSPGRAFLASLGEDERTTLLRKLVANRDAGDDIADLPQAERLIRAASSYGCGFRDQGFIPRTCSLAVPIRVRGEPAAFLTLVVMRAVMSVDRTIDTYLPAAQATATEIETLICQRQQQADTAPLAH